MCLRNDQLMVGSTLKISLEPATVKSLLRAVNHAEDEHLVYREPGRALLGGVQVVKHLLSLISSFLCNLNILEVDISWH